MKIISRGHLKGNFVSTFGRGVIAVCSKHLVYELTSQCQGLLLPASVRASYWSKLASDWSYWTSVKATLPIRGSQMTNKSPDNGWWSLTSQNIVVWFPLCYYNLLACVAHRLIWIFSSKYIQIIFRSQFALCYPIIWSKIGMGFLPLTWA